MQKIDDTSFSAMRSSQNQPEWLELAEYASIAGSAIGTIVAGLSGQIIYAAAPLTAAVSLNFVNRQRFEQKMQQKANSAIAGVELAVKSIQQQVQALPGEPTELYSAVSDLQQKLGSLESHTLADVRAALQSLEQQVQAFPGESQQLYPMLSQLQQKLCSLENSALREQDWENMNVRFLLMDERLTEVKNITAELQQRSSEIDFNQIQGTVMQLQVLLDRPAIDVATLQTEIDRLQQQVSELQRLNQEIVKPYLQRLTRAMKKLSQ
jgi:CII-binding regulator of phage lambda lysogenization HflD